MEIRHTLRELLVGVKPPTPTWGGMLRNAFETGTGALADGLAGGDDFSRGAGV